MQESYIHLDGEWFFLRHSEIHPSRRTILFVHGLGESSLCFREAFDRLHLLDCNLVAPDNLGYGRSSVARNGDYSFRAQIARLANLVSPACGIGQTYDSLRLPKIYCWGGKHLSEASQRFLNQVGLQNRTFKAASHWPMIDCPEEFYSVLKAWIAQDVPPL